MKPLTRLNKELKEVENLLLNIDQVVKNGSFYYLGEHANIYRQIVVEEKIKLEIEINKLNQQL